MNPVEIIIDEDEHIYILPFMHYKNAKKLATLFEATLHNPFELVQGIEKAKNGFLFVMSSAKLLDMEFPKEGGYMRIWAHPLVKKINKLVAGFTNTEKDVAFSSWVMLNISGKTLRTIVKYDKFEEMIECLRKAWMNGDTATQLVRTKVALNIFIQKIREKSSAN